MKRTPDEQAFRPLALEVVFRPPPRSATQGDAREGGGAASDCARGASNKSGAYLLFGLGHYKSCMWSRLMIER